MLIGCGADSTPEPSALLGRRALHGYHLLANAATTLPDGASGFLTTADGHGGFHLSWLAAPGVNAHFSGTVTTDRGFDPNGTVKLTGSELVSFDTTTQISFSASPGRMLEGVSFAVENPSDAAYFNLSVDGMGAEIFFTGAVTGLIQQSAYDPVAFTSP
jgi:hypothetical protein